MNSTNWPALNVWVFIAQLVERCIANAEAMGWNPVEAPKTFFELNCDCLNRKHNCDDHTFICISAVHIIFTIKGLTKLVEKISECMKPFNFIGRCSSLPFSRSNNRELTQQDGWNTDEKM